jgi:hypothetical protein
VRTVLGPRAEIHRRIDGRWTLLATGRAPWQGMLRFDVAGSEQRLAIDGRIVARAQDTAVFEAGSLGLEMLGRRSRAGEFRAT